MPEPTRIDKLMAMAVQTESPHEAQIAQDKLATMGMWPPPPPPPTAVGSPFPEPDPTSNSGFTWAWATGQSSGTINQQVRGRMTTITVTFNSGRGPLIHPFGDE